MVRILCAAEIRGNRERRILNREEMGMLTEYQ